MNLITVDEGTFDIEYQASTDAIRDFLYTYFEISVDCRPIGDWDRAELGKVDPYRFLDVDYDSSCLQVRGPSELRVLHQGAAINLLCRLAQVYDVDMIQDSRFLADFTDPQYRTENEELLRKYAPDLFPIEEAFRAGRIVETPSIQRAFTAAFSDLDDFYPSLEAVLSDVIFPTFVELYQ